MTRVRVPILEWAEMELAVEVNELAPVIGTQLFWILNSAGYSDEEIATIAADAA